MAEKSTEVGIPSPEYDEMAASWDLPDALLGGSRAMRNQRWLPKNPGESHRQWIERARRTVLFNAYRDALRTAQSRPFSRPVSIDFTAQKPPQLSRFLTRTDAEGNDLTSFERRVAFDAYHRGVAHVLVDMPPQNPARTLADDGHTGPYQCLISAVDLIGWNEGRDAYYNKFLEEIRFVERRWEDNGQYGQAVMEFVRVIRIDGTWELWRPVAEDHKQTRRSQKYSEDPNSDTEPRRLSATAWMLEDSGVSTYRGDQIPLDTFYANRTGFMTGRPAFEELAWVNLQHYQRDSGLNQILSVLDCPILFKKGFDETIDDLADGSSQVVAGPNSSVSAEAEHADMKYVEHSGSAVGKSMEQISKLEDRMERYGLRPLQMRVQSATATGQAISENRASSDVQEWAIAQKQSLERRLQIAGRWVGLELTTDDFEVNLFTDFDAVSASSTADFESLKDIWKEGGLTDEALLLEAKRRAMVSPAFDPIVEAEEARAAKDRETERMLSAMPSMPSPEPDDADADER